MTRGIVWSSLSVNKRLIFPVALDLHKVLCSYLVCIFLGSRFSDDININDIVTLTLGPWHMVFQTMFYLGKFRQIMDKYQLQGKFWGLLILVAVMLH